MRQPNTPRPHARPWVVGLICAALTVSMLTPVQAEVLAGAEASTLQQEPQVTPSELAPDAVPGLKYADPTEGLSLIDPPTANSGGGAQVSYPILVPKGRGLAPELSIDYDSGGGSSWAGQGWDIGASSITVDTAFGVPRFCPRVTKPACGNVESESYQLDGEALMPAAVTSAPKPRVAERSDFTRRVETTYDKIVRHGTSPKNYTWEVTDKAGDVFFYGMQPDAGGPLGGPGTRTKDPSKDWTDLDDLSADPSSILSDAAGNRMTWYLTAQRDVGVNMMRYQYDTVWFKAFSDVKTHSTTWSVVDQSECTGTAVCAKHVYLKKIWYTGVAEASPGSKGEDPAYVVEFHRSAGVRDDAVLDARGGFLDLDGQQLTDITVTYLRTVPVTRTLQYHLAYDTGRYGKTQLHSIDQVGCGGPAKDSDCDDSTKATHTFTYYDDAKKGALEPATTWDTTDNSLGAKSLENRASALGMSATNAGDGHLYLGFNVLDPSKTGSFGVSLTFGGGSTESLVEFMDINGDGLPDKVFRTNPNVADDSSTLQFALNTSKPDDPPGTPVVFGTAHEIAGSKGEQAPNRLPIEHNAGFGVGLEAYFGVFGMFNVSGEWNWSQGYFNDVNGDGLPDYITAGKVRFNHLECTDPTKKTTCIPTFGASDDKTRVPLTTDAPSSRTTDPDVVARRQMLAELSPQIDTVRRWVAPYSGKVTIASAAALLPCKDAGETLASCPNADVRLAIQKGADELASSKVSATGDVWARTLTNVDVAKGTPLYFRMGADPLSEGRAVSWDPVVTYSSFGSGAGANPAPDANGLSQKVFRASTDFTVAGRPGAMVNLPAEGDVRFEGFVEKKSTSDDVRPTVVLRDGAKPHTRHDQLVTVQPVLADGKDDPARTKTVYTNASAQHCVKDGAGTEYGCWPDEQSAKDQLQLLTKHETGLFKLLSAFPVAAPVKNDKGVVVDQDGVTAHFAVDSPIDVNRLSWVTAPRLCYGPADGECDGSVMDLVPPVDTDVYPDSTTDGPRAPWTAPASKSTTVKLTVDVGSLTDVGDRTAYLTVKTAHDGYVVKEPVAIDPVAGSVTKNVTFAATSGTDYWFDLTVRDPVLPDRLSHAKVDVTPDKGSTDSLDLTLNSTGRQGIFPLPYRGWGVAGYLGNDGREATPLQEADFVVTQANGKPFDTKDDACQTLMKQACMDSSDVSGMTFPGSYSGGGSTGPAFDASAVKSRFSKAYAYLPAVVPGTTGVSEQWQGPNAHLGADASGQRSALLGGALPGKDTPGGALEPPTLEGSTGPSFAVTGGVGPLGVSFGFGWSRSFVDYLDMNGDGFPDVVSTDKVTYTNPRGGQSCLQSDGTTPACEGTGVDAVNMDTTLAISGGFSGSPVSVKGNVHGVTSSTRGSSASKGGATSADEYGAGIGAGAEISASFGSPNTADPNWDENKVSSDSTKIPGQPLGKDSDVATQRTLADVNGDGLPDKIQASPAGVQVWFNLGYGFASTPVPWSTGGFESNEGYAGGFEFGLGFSGWNKDFSGGVSHNASINFPRFSWTDVNGDGILDALHRDDSDGTVKLAYGTGTGLGPQVNLGADDAPAFRLAGDIKVPIKGQVRQDQSVGYGVGADVTVAFGPLCIALCYLIVNPGAHFENSLSVSDVSLEDVNGDGSADSVQRVPAGSGSNQEKLSVQLNSKRRTGLLESVTNPLHGSFTLDYQRDGNSIEHPGSQWNLAAVTVDDGRNGDGERDGSDTSRTTFRYDGLRYDFLHREEAGYATVDTNELDAKGGVVRVTRDEYSNTDVFDAGQLLRTTLYAGTAQPDHVVQRTTNTWTTKEGASGLPFDRSTLSTEDQYSMWVRPAITSTEQELADATTGVVQQRTRVDYTFDSFGDPTTIVDRGLAGDPSDDITASISYSDCAQSVSDATLLSRCGSQASQQGLPAFWRTSTCPTWVHTPATMEVRDAAGNLLRYRNGAQALCDNNSVTLLRQLVSGTIGGGDYAETDLSYDAYGSYDRIVYPLGSNGTRYAVHYVYDKVNAANVAQVTDYELSPDDAATFISDGPGFALTAPSRQGVTTTSTFDGPSGRVATTMNGTPPKAGDPVPPTTAFGYDALGRISTVTAPDGGTIRYAYHPTDAAYAYATAQHDDAVNGGTIDTVAFADGLGRVTQQKREATFFSAVDRTPTTGFAVTGGVSYDTLGRELKQYQPRRQDGGALTAYDPIPNGARATVNEFDVLDRVTSSTAPGGRATLTSYGFTPDGSTVETETDPRMRQTVTTSDARENVVSVADVAVGKPPVVTTYGYTRMGELSTVSSGGRTQTTNTYDLLGRRLSTDTADGGKVLYGFDAAGNQVSSQSSVQRAAGTQTTYGYSFGHLVAVDYADSTPRVKLAWGGYDGVTVAPQDSGRLVGVHDGARIQSFGYDVNGQVATEGDTMTDAHWKLGQITTATSHDYLGRVRTVTYPDQEKVSYGYDSGGSMKSVRGQKSCTDLGTLVAGITETQTTISVRETPLVAPPALPFTFRIGSEQLRATARTVTPDGIATYTVERGINGTLAVPTAAPHSAGSALVSDSTLTCDYRYVNRLEYDEYGTVAFQQLGNGNRVQRVHDADTRALSRVFADAPSQPRAVLGTLTAAAGAGATTMTVREGFTAPPTPFLASVGSETVRVTGRVPTATTGVFTWTVARGASGTTAASQPSGSGVQVDRVQQNLGYAYDKAGNVTDLVNDLPADVTSLFGGPSRQHYGYDGYYRVTSANGSWDTAPSTRRDYSLTLGYDPVSGNLSSKTQRVEDKNPSCTRKCKVDTQEATTYSWDPIGYTSAGPHQATTLGGQSYRYDLDGNVTSISSADNVREMTWDSAGRMTSIVDRPNGNGGKPTYYTYDYQGQRAIEDKEQGRSWFVNPWVTVRDGTMWKNIWAGDTRLGTKFTQANTYESKSYYFQTDLQGSTNVVSDSTGKMFQHQEYLPGGEVWVKEDSTIFRTPYQALGAYYDEDHGLTDLGQRWRDPRSQAFYGVDPQVFSDPWSQLTDPTSVRAYTFAADNPLTNGDPDGAAWNTLNASAAEIAALSRNLEADGESLTSPQRASFVNFFLKHRGLKGKIAFALVEQAHARAKFAKKWDMKPLFEITLGFEKGPGQATGTYKGVENVKLSVGTGKRIKRTGSADPGNAPAAAAAPTAPMTAPSAPNPVRKAPKPLPKIPAKQAASSAAVTGTQGK